MAGAEGAPPGGGRTKGPGTRGDATDGFLGRWSRRKAAARSAETEAGAEGGAETAADPAEAEALLGRPAAEPLPEQAFDPDTLPDIDQLTEQSDFSVFMQAGVPPALRSKALRRLWLLKPKLANLDGLVDYGEDLTGSFKPMTNLQTAYKVGRGFLDSIKSKEVAAKRAARASARSEPDAAIPDSAISDGAISDAAIPDGIDPPAAEVETVTPDRVSGEPAGPEAEDDADALPVTKPSGAKDKA
jgi:hypothetical protein